MARALIELKLTVLRHARARRPAVTGALLGLVLAAGVLWLATMDPGSAAALRDVLAVVLAMWALGWVLAPVWAAAPVPRPEELALLPLRPRQLSIGLLAAALVGIGPAVTLLAFAALVVYGARHSPSAGLVGVLVAVGQLLLVVLASLLVGRARAVLGASRVGAAVSGVVTAVMLVLSQSGWVVLVALGALLETGFSTPVPTALHALPTSWGLLAVDAAVAARWWPAVGWVAAQAAAVGALLWLWSRALQHGPRPRRTILGPLVPGSWSAPGLSPAVAAVVRRELRAWRREPARVQVLVVAPVFAVLTAAVLLPFGSSVLLPWLGALTALMTMVSTTNPYGQDGTGLWLTLSVPGAIPADVRGRQFGWTVATAPLVLALTLVGLPLHGDPSVWPWAVAVTGSLLGAGAGSHVYLGVASLVPGRDPHRTRDDPLDHGDVTGAAFTAFFGALLAPLPALGTLLLSGPEPPLWAGALAGAFTGAAWYTLLGRAAERGLLRRAPELLLLMRTGRPEAVATSSSTLDTMPRQRALWACVVVGTIALVPQALVPAVMKLTDNVAPVWFLALHLPPRLQWPTIAAMVALATVAFLVAGHLYRTARLSAPGTTVATR